MGLEGFTQTLAAEVRSHNIRANTVEPGYVATKLTGYAGSKPESVTEVFVYWLRRNPKMLRVRCQFFRMETELTT